MELRAYYFGNMYLSSIQQGIQAAHVTANMFTKYPQPELVRRGGSDNSGNYLWTWANQYKTMILLNAGYGAAIHDLRDFFSEEDNPYPWDVFFEEEAALDGAVTSIGIILPERIYNTAAVIRANPGVSVHMLRHEDYLASSHIEDVRELPNDFTHWELDMIEKLPQYGLAR